MWVCQHDKHNKWWTYDVKGNTVTTRYGRIGLKGQKSSKNLGNKWDRDAFIDKKRWEKERKGYRPVSEEEFNLFKLQAEILGSGNKVERTALVLDNGKTLTEIHPEDAFDPSLKPNVLIEFRLRDRDGSTEPFEVLFTTDEAFDIETRREMRSKEPKHTKFRHPTTTWKVVRKSKVDNSHQFHKVIEPLMEVIGSTAL
jgi:predicted DNA-binding WGR domain protein